MATNSPNKPQASPHQPEPANKPKARPAIEVLVERCHRVRRPVEALCSRLDQINDDGGHGLTKAVDDLRLAMNMLTGAMIQMRASGCKCPVTPKSRALAKLRPGARVCFVSTDTAYQFAEVYSEDELLTLKVERRNGDDLWLTTGSRPAGRVHWSEVRLAEDFDGEVRSKETASDD